MYNLYVETPFQLSVIIPVYNEHGNINTLLERLLPVVSRYHYEVIFIDDGSTDKTTHDIGQHVLKNPRIKLVSFTRNFGHQRALSAGYAYAQGDAVVSIDADLQDPPELIPDLIKKWREGNQIVYAKRRTRTKDSFFKRLSAHAFYWFINKLSEIPIPTDVGDYRLVDRQVVDYLNKLPESSRFLRGLVAWSGYQTAMVEFDRDSRHVGNTHYPLKKMVSFAMTGITAFSVKPLRLVTYLGFITAFLGFAGMSYAIIRRFLLPHEYWVTGWTALFVSIMFFSGIQILILGMIGEYIGRIFGQVQSRPLYVIKSLKNITPSNHT